MSATQRPRRRGNPILDFFNSIWLGIFLIVLIFCYGTLGSAVPQTRQVFELTEFQYFNHWIFTALIVLFCINLIVATIRRIKFNMINAGVLAVHTGLLLLCGSSIWYFGSKVEGDVLMAPAKIAIYSNDRFQTDPTNAQVGQIVAAKGRTWDMNIPMLGGAHKIEVVDVKRLGMNTAEEVTLKVTIGNEPPRFETMTTRETGDRFARFAKVSDRLTAALEPARSVTKFYDNTTPSLSLVVGSTLNDRREFSLPALPYYSERFIALDDDKSPGAGRVDYTDGTPVPSNRTAPIPLVEYWRMPIPVLNADDALAKDLGYSVEIDGYLPYADMDARPIEGGAELYPVAQVAMGRGSRLTSADLESLNPANAMFDVNNGPRMEFDWIGDATELNPDWTRRVEGQHIIDVEVKDKGVRKSYDVNVGDEIKVEGTDYTLKIEQLRPNWPLMTAGFKGARTSIALVWVESPEKSYQRSVMDRFPQLNQDRNREGKKISPTTDLVDDNIVITYTNASTDHVRLVAGENFAPTIVHTAVGGRRDVKKLDVGEPVVLGDDLNLVLKNLIVRPVLEARPAVIPVAQRRSLMNVGRQKSMIRVHLAALDGSWSRRVWVGFSQYNLDHTDIFGGGPTMASNLPSGRSIGLIYGRQRNDLPTPVILEELVTQYYPGGQQAREWTSYFRYKAPGSDQVQEGKAFLNNTYTIGNWTLFQSAAAQDGSSWTVLGVGNRNGVLLQLLACAIISLGMVWAFAVKPALKKRRNARIAASSPRNRGAGKESNEMRDPSRKGGVPVAVKSLLIGVLLVGMGVGCHKEDVIVKNKALDEIKAIEKDIDVEKLGAIAMLDNNAWRYTTVESWARKTMRTMHGSVSLEGLDPVVSAMEMMFNQRAYLDQPVIFVKDRGVLKDLTKHPIKVSDEESERMYKQRCISYEFFMQAPVQARIRELSGETLKSRAMNRMGAAKFCFEEIRDIFTVVPVPNGTKETQWIAPQMLLDPQFNKDALGISENMALSVLEPYVALAKAWQQRDAKAINTAVDNLATALPRLAPEGTYPSLETCHAEQSYRRMNLLRYGWGGYIFAFFVSIFALATGYKWPRYVALTFLIAAIGIHGYDLWLRWGVLGRIPVANMYEAVVSSTWCGAAFGLLLEFFTRKRVFMFASALLGFFALSLPEIVPDTINDNLQTMMPILDDAMLRIHTVLIISSYAVITLAFGVANCYLFVEAVRKNNALSRATIGAQLGALVVVLLGIRDAFAHVDGWGIVGIAALSIVGGAMIGLGGFAMVCGAAKPAAGAFDASAFPVERTKSILDDFDLCHRVLLYTATVALFVGIVLGAVWADYSWGRPWGWDPKEVFALNTWLIYAILIHARYVTKHRGLWTSVLSVVGFAVMQFNWWVVNFYIVGLHSYA
ncbi:MAG TPA: cytochrome c biogenesis protein CcsA [Phycisphaerae bacterium]|nr:cytochrome c biogenesis protein CcsA [Phycisphaerae bacterium]HRW53738.1 cytochrome c biogenesis protein CcsA [Phycisphaerae bacterium]